VLTRHSIAKLSSWFNNKLTYKCNHVIKTCDSDVASSPPKKPTYLGGSNSIISATHKAASYRFLMLLFTKEQRIALIEGYYWDTVRVAHMHSDNLSPPTSDTEIPSTRSLVLIQ
jgi:hypothetical protein